ncbi:DUF6542 domain-containing protein, partial [Rhodococcus triatomae]
MSANQRARSGVPLDSRSTLPGVPGLPWWGVVAVAAGLSAVGFAIDAVRGNELTTTFSAFYVLGCILAVLVAANRALFTAMVQPPLILFAGVPIGQFVLADGSSLALRDLAINIAYPLVDRFPVMLVTTVLTLAIGGSRLFLLGGRRTGPSRRSGSRNSDRREPAQRRSSADRRGTSRSSSTRESARATATRTSRRVREEEPAAEVPARPRRRPAPPVDAPRRPVDDP